jgi:glycosyltransferase involved in cell wall biosynthesis
MRDNLLFVGSLCSDKVFDSIFNTSKIRSGQSMQKFISLLLSGAAQQKDVSIRTITSLPIAPDVHQKKFWNLGNDFDKRIYFNYNLTFNLPILKNLLDFFLSFVKVFLWRFSGEAKSKAIVCDILKLSTTAGAFIAAKLSGIKAVAIITDMPGLDVIEGSFIHQLKSKVILSFITRFDAYILITEHMNQIVNPFGKNYMVMEGLVDSSMNLTENRIESKAQERILLYSGGIFERYGVKNLIDAFNKLEGEDLRLFIYGDGPMAKDMPRYVEIDNRIKYFGVVANDEVVKAQVFSTLLINPRPSHEEYTKYSFPSKNMEYMVSGTPIVTANLPGMPREYLPFVYLLEEEDLNGIFNTLDQTLKKSREELHDFGMKSKEFVLSQKNNFLQGGRVTKFISEI